MTLSQEDHKALVADIQAAERRADARIVCIVAKRSHNDHTASFVAAALIALTSGWLFAFTTQWPAQRLLLAQLCVFLVGVSVAALVPSPLWARSKRWRRAAVFQAAATQFFIEQKKRPHPNGMVLLYISQSERLIRIITDNRIDERAPEAPWRKATALASERFKHGDLMGGLAGAISSIADALEQRH